MDEIVRLIASGNIRSILQLMFDDVEYTPVLRKGFFHEGQFWDFKSEVPGSGKSHESAWAEIAKHVLAFHNAQGGLLIFGIDDIGFTFIGSRNRCDSAMFNNGIRKYVGDLFHVTFERTFIHGDQTYLGVALIPAHGPKIVRFLSDAPTRDGMRIFSRGDVPVREGDSSKILRGADANTYVSDLATTRVGRGFAIDEEYYRILAPEYRSFVYRRKLCDEVMEGLLDPRVAVVSLTGIGGVGKTALATWTALEAYRNNMFNFIVSITAKDRELTARLIEPLDKHLTSYEELIQAILRVLRVEEELTGTLEEKEVFLRELLDDSNGLLYVDNLETVDDQRIIQFLHKLPLGVRALVTSRIPRIKRSNFPIDVGRLEDYEVLEFIDAMIPESQYEYLSEFSSADRLSYGDACNRIPLAMRWVAARCKNIHEALSQARDINIKSHTSEELLEFSFRRIFDNLKEDERSILKVISVYRRPLTLEAIHIAGDISYQNTADLLETLTDAALVEVLYDDEINANAYTLLPITSSFVYGEVRKDPHTEDIIRNRMRDWLEAKEIKDPVRKALAQRLRQGQESSEEILLELAREAQRKGALVDAERYFIEAIKRNAKSWPAHRSYAEYLRHYAQETGKAIEHYRAAAQHVPKTDKINRPLIFRELAILLKQSGDPNGLSESTKYLELSREINSKDPIAANVLAGNYVKLGKYQQAVKLLTPFRVHHNMVTREYILRTLLESYERLGEPIEVAYIKRELEDSPNRNFRYII